MQARDYRQRADSACLALELASGDAARQAANARSERLLVELRQHREALANMLANAQGTWLRSYAAGEIEAIDQMIRALESTKQGWR